MASMSPSPSRSIAKTSKGSATVPISSLVKVPQSAEGAAVVGEWDGAEVSPQSCSYHATAASDADSASTSPSPSTSIAKTETA